LISSLRRERCKIRGQIVILARLTSAVDTTVSIQISFLVSQKSRFDPIGGGRKIEI